MFLWAFVKYLNHITTNPIQLKFTHGSYASSSIFKWLKSDGYLFILFIYLPKPSQFFKFWILKNLNFTTMKQIKYMPNTIIDTTKIDIKTALETLGLSQP
jgi:hypothetical protein